MTCRPAILCAVALSACGTAGAAKPQKLPAHPPLDPASIVQYPATTFLLGLDGGAQGPDGSNWWVNEEPAHPVSLSAFALERNEVTAARYATFLAWAGGLGHYSSRMHIDVGPTTADFAASPGEEDAPVGEVTWFDARAYCLWMGGDLPTEAQWELAAKGVGARTYPWDPDAGGPACLLASFFTGDVSCTAEPVDAGSTPGGDTPEGLQDMAGNVAEWTLDAYDWYPMALLADGGLDFYSPAGGEPIADPRGPDAGPVYDADAGYGLSGSTLRVVRGGGFHDLGISIRTTARWGADADLRSPGVGFRCAYPPP